MKSLRMAFVEVVYVQVKRNGMRVRNVTKGVECAASPEATFTTNRLLVGEFEVAEAALRAAIKSLHKGIFPPAPLVVIQPLEMTEGGLSSLEQRIFTDLALGAGAAKASVWVGKELSDPEVQQIAESL